MPRSKLSSLTHIRYTVHQDVSEPALQLLQFIAQQKGNATFQQLLIKANNSLETLVELIEELMEMKLIQETDPSKVTFVEDPWEGSPEAAAS
ncbi:MULTISPECIES: hypothetical protein [Acaryochloris]|uniref:Uncharacterized protein n=1 Tax=Acaryochloris marina (strain MBIC 11017) TaxID=329726 RepID=B0C6C0_ACAM1|nr:MULTISPECIES: hypothetical protein [Acaryochloris]ABW25214.1 hypothetical protein AM1_0128 [Acaryochloris marina MBIC11017]KAI9130342.1 hypothetical protein ON05_021115 [Acaryochloris sp. CCMEE 5410]BDM80180.1 hypothetical protein AM10699_30480 [Acaryochloris marina MBIC10699]